MKGQLSAEMLILIAVIIAVVAIAATRLISTAQKSSDTVGNQSDVMLETAEAAMKSPAGGPCTITDNCDTGLTCINKVCN